MSSGIDMWRRVLDGIDTDAPPALEVAERLADARGLDPVDAQDRVFDAIDAGVLVEDGDGFGGLRLATDHTAVSEETTPENTEKRSSGDNTPTAEAADTGTPDAETEPASVATWQNAEFATPDPRVWAPAQIQNDAWMGRKADGGKAPYAPWADADAPVECNHSDHDNPTTCAECSHHAGYKWGSDGSRQHVHTDHETALEWADKDPTLSSDLVYIQREDDPFAFVDGDDVRDPETGEIHPGFRAILEHLGVTYADISTSGSGVHAVYRGEIPLDGVSQAMFDLDDEPFGANDDAPAVEIYANKHVCIATGDHVGGTGTEVVEWDDDALAAILRANGYDDKPEPSADTNVDLDDHTPTATETDETTDDIKDIFYALDRLDARRVAADTIVHSWNDSATTSGDNQAFAPEWGPSANGTANIVDREIWQDTGGRGYGGVDVMAAIDCPDLPSYDERTQPSDLDGADWFRAVDHLRSLGYAIPELEDSDDSADKFDDDPRDAEVVLNPRRAWDAAGRVTPADLDTDLPLDTTKDGESWNAGGVTVDVVRAVAVAEFGHAAEATLDSDTYDRAYRHARDAYGAPLPEYVTAADAADRYDVVIGAVRALDFHDLDAAALTADVTEADEAGDVTHYIDPSPVDGWRDSDSGESVLVFDSGTVWDADTEETIDALRLAALDAGLIDAPTEALEGGLFERAYRVAREDYGAPLPRWAIGTPEVEPVLPPAEELTDAVPDSGDDLQDARDDVERLYRRLARSEGDGDVAVLRALPGLGKTTSAIKSAGLPFDTGESDDPEGMPTAYLAPRKELQQDAAEKADKWGASWAHLPVFGTGGVSDVAVDAAVAAVRENSQQLLRDKWTLSGAVEAQIGEELSPEDDEDSIDLDRPTCPCAEGDHGEVWALVVHAARQLDYSPRDIHERAEALFGSALPCQEDGDCAYSAGWDRIADPDRPLDLVIGSYGHAHVESARTHYDTDERGNTERTERAVVLDEFPGDAFTEEFGPEFVDHAVWLASALRDDVADRQDLFSADLWGDDWVRSWLRGDGVEGDVGAAHDALLDLSGLMDAFDTAEDVLDGYTAFADGNDLTDPLEALRDAGAALDAAKADRIAEAVRQALNSVDGQHGGRIAAWLAEDIVDPLEDYAGVDPRTALPDTVSGDLRAFVEDAAEAADDNREGAAGLLEAAATALEGGDAGCRELAVHADDGYAHRLAHRLLAGVAAPADGDGVADVIETSAFDYSADGFDGTRLKHVRVDAEGGTDTVLVDREHEGATVLSPPSRTAGNGEECPVVGLDATARRRLWGLMLGANVSVEDIHESMAERARFLRDGLGLQVVRTAQKNRFYEGDPAGKDTDGDVALIEEINDEYTGVYAGGRDEATDTVGSPAVITTKGVRNVLEEDDRLDGKVAAFDNYGNITGDNDLGDHRLAAVLGCQHYGDHAVEKVAALAGEEVTRSGHGRALSYGSPVADTYLQHMTEDQTMQAILRFTRGDSGAVVFARTAALRDDLPVVGEGQVVRSWSDTAATVARAWKAHRGERFTVADVADSVDVTRRQVRRVLDEFTAAGYLEKHDTGAGRANEFAPGADPSAGEVELPGGVDPDISRKGTIYTGNVRVWSLEDGQRRGPRPTRSTLPAPEAEDGVAPPG